MKAESEKPKAQNAEKAGQKDQSKMPTISHDEVRKHNGPKSLWIIIHNNVYDVTKFMNEHPGGAGTLLDFSGKDATQAFEFAGHSDKARKMMNKFKIGVLPVGEQTSHHKLCDMSVCGSERCLRCPSSRSDRAVGAVSTRRRRRSRGPPCGSSAWKWALLVLAGALIAGIIVKKYVIKN